MTIEELDLAIARQRLEIERELLRVRRAPFFCTKHMGSNTESQHPTPPPAKLTAAEHNAFPRGRWSR